MGDYEPFKTYATWTGDADNAEIWIGEPDAVVFTPEAQWEELYHEEDYQGIADQLFAEEQGYA